MSSRIHWVDSPAKLNLFLHINGRYENGYHQLQTLFQILNYGDKIGIEINATSNIEIATPMPGVAEQDNLVYHAACLLQQSCGIHLGCKIHIHKVLPMGGGIGGGSSNAASTMVLLNNLWGCNLSTQTMADIGLQLGADVPVFIHGKTAFANGVGENLHPTKLAQKWYLVATPNVHCSTAEVFSHPELPRQTPLIEHSAYKFEETRNDCETLVAKLHPDVANLLQWLLNYAPSRMTGTGASVFSVFESQQIAESVLQQLPHEYAGFVACGVNESALNQQMRGL